MNYHFYKETSELQWPMYFVDLKVTNHYNIKHDIISKHFTSFRKDSLLLISNDKKLMA